MQTCNPLTARQWFNLRTPVNWVIAFAVFVPLVFVLQNFIGSLLADVISLVVAFCLFFFILERRAIGIICPACQNYIETNISWVCGFCRKTNVRTDEFPFINRCQHTDCIQEPKAYQCHHCSELIYFSKDKLKYNYAVCANLPVIAKSKPEKKDPLAEKAVRRREEKSDLEHELEVTRIKGDLKEAKSRIAPPAKKRTPFEELEEYYKSTVGNEDAARMWRAAIEKEFKHDKDECDKRLLVVDQWMRNRLD